MVSHQHPEDTSIPPLATSNVITPKSQVSVETQKAIGVHTSVGDKVKDFFTGKSSADKPGSVGAVHHDSPITGTGQRQDETIEAVVLPTATGEPAEKISKTGVVHH